LETTMRRTLLFLALLLLLPLAVHAQDTLTVGELKPGVVAAGNQPQTFQVNIPLAGIYEIAVAESEPGVAPQFSVMTMSGIPVATAANPTAAAIIQQDVEFSEPGLYLLSVDSSTGTSGRFIVQILPGRQLPPIMPLGIGQLTQGTIATGGGQRFGFSADPVNTLTVSISGQVSSELTDSAGNSYGRLSELLAGGSMIVPPGTTGYVLMLSNDTQMLPADFSLILTAGDSVIETEPVAPPPPEATSRPQPVLPPSGACVLATEDMVFVNVRSMPTTDGDNRIGQISPYETYMVVGRVSDNSWYEIMADSIRGWVAASVTRTGGDCANVPVTFTPPTPAPMMSPTPMMTPMITATPQIAEDFEVNTTFPFERGSTWGFSGDISYPLGDRQDTVQWRLTGVPSNPPSGTQFRYSIRCTGPGVEFAEIVFLSDGSTRPCTETATNFVQVVTATSRRDEAVTFRLTGGDNAFVRWRIQFNWFIP
jgi:hypothetical protein